MQELSLFGESRMTVKELAYVLGVSVELITKRVRELYPDIMKHGVTTYLDETQVTAIKIRISENTSIAVTPYDRTKLADMPKTNLEKELLIMQAMQFQQERIHHMQEMLTKMAPKAEVADALCKSLVDMSITDACKHFGLHPKVEVFPYLRKHGFLTSKDLPTQYAIDMNVLSLRQNLNKRTGRFNSQAIVKQGQLPRFKTLIAEKVGK